MRVEYVGSLRAGGRFSATLYADDTRYANGRPNGILGTSPSNSLFLSVCFVFFFNFLFFPLPTFFNNFFFFPFFFLCLYLFSFVISPITLIFHSLIFYHIFIPFFYLYFIPFFLHSFLSSFLHFSFFLSSSFFFLYFLRSFSVFFLFFFVFLLYWSLFFILVPIPSFSSSSFSFVHCFHLFPLFLPSF